MLANSGAATPAAVAALARQGRLAEALRMGESLVARPPFDYRIDHLVGVIACQAGQPARGAQLLHRAMKARPGDADITFNLAKALADSADFDAALALCAAAGADARMQRLEAEILKRAGNTPAAIAAWRRHTAASPDDAEAWNNFGTALMASDHLDEALAALERARQIDPSRVPILRNLSRALLLAGREEAALDVLRDAFDSAPGDSTVLLDFGQALIRLLRPREAIAVLADAARTDTNNPAIFTAIGLAYAALAEFGAAEEAYHHALAAAPAHPPALLNLGVLLEQSNRIEPLRELVAGAEARGIGAEGAAEMAMLRALVLRRDNHFAEALAEVQTITGDAVDETMTAQTIAQLADRTGDADLAFANYSRMNALTAQSPAGRTFDGSEHRRFVEGMVPIVTPHWFAGWTPAAPSDYPTPAFLVGFPRSGTTLLDTALIGHPQVAVLEEEPVLRAVADEAGPLEQIGQLHDAELERLRLLYLEEVAKIAPAAGGKLIIDKMPLNTLRGPLIARLFPGAPIIFALRHPCDAVLSCFMQNFRINQAMASFLTLENAAKFYDASMAYWMQCREVLPLNVHELRYEQLVEDSEPVLRGLTGFLGLPWHDGVLRHQETASARGFIRTPSYAQVTEGMYLRSRGRWERYRAHMAPVLDILAPWAIRFGYGDPRSPG